MTNPYLAFGSSKRNKALLEQMIRARQQELEHFKLMINYIEDDEENLEQWLRHVEKELD